VTAVADQFCGKVPKNVTAFPFIIIIIIIIIIIWFITHVKSLQNE